MIEENDLYSGYSKNHILSSSVAGCKYIQSKAWRYIKNYKIYQQYANSDMPWSGVCVRRKMDSVYLNKNIANLNVLTASLCGAQN